MSRKKYKEYFPLNDSEELRTTTYKDLSYLDKKKWRNFILISKSKFISDKLAFKQSDICPVCDKKIEESKRVIHHLDYKNLCVKTERIRVQIPTEKYPDRKVSSPNCNNCDLIDNCLNKIVLLHNHCHFTLHIIEGRIKKPKNPEAEEKKEIIKRKNQSFWKQHLNKEDRIIIQKSIDIFREEFPETEFKLKYNSRNIIIKPYNFLIFKLKNRQLVIRIKNGDKEKINAQLFEIGIGSRLHYKKDELYSITFSITLGEFNQNLYLFKQLFINTVYEN